jgi:GNAT superfamily N-acetyltransferase
MSMVENIPVSLKESQLVPGAELFARVFRHAPDMEYLLGSESKMFQKRTLRFYRAVIRTGLRYGETYTTPNLDGVAVWVKPENTQFTPGMLIRTGLLLSLLALGPRPIGRFIKSANYLEELHEKVISEPHWILVQLGVEPDRQSMGIGGKLIRPVLDKADAEGLPCYTESADERNLTFYQRHGFEVRERGQVPINGPRVWILVREAAMP